MGRRSGGCFPEGLSGRAMILTLRPHTVLTLKTCGSIPPQSTGPAPSWRDVYLKKGINLTQEINSEIILGVNFE
jgi:hypothetical protein